MKQPHAALPILLTFLAACSGWGSGGSSMPPPIDASMESDAALDTATRDVVTRDATPPPDTGGLGPGARCVLPREDGARCETIAFQNECGIASYCDASTSRCTPRRQIGVSCSYACRGWGCAQPDDCVIGAFCRLDISECAPRASAEGAPCAPDDNAFACTYGLSCESGRCVTADPNRTRTLGEWCTSGWYPCAEGLVCNADQECVPQRERGETCVDSRECAPGLACSFDRVCDDPPTEGAPCLDRCELGYRCGVDG